MSVSSSSAAASPSAASSRVCTNLLDPLYHPLEYINPLEWLEYWSDRLGGCADAEETRHFAALEPYVANSSVEPPLVAANGTLADDQLDVVVMRFATEHAYALAAASAALLALAIALRYRQGSSSAAARGIGLIDARSERSGRLCEVIFANDISGIRVPPNSKFSKALTSSSEQYEPASKAHGEARESRGGGHGAHVGSSAVGTRSSTRPSRDRR